MGIPQLCFCDTKSLYVAIYKRAPWEFPSGPVVKDPAIVTAVVQVQSFAWEHLHAVGVAKKKKKKSTVVLMVREELAGAWVLDPVLCFPKLVCEFLAAVICC